MERYLGRFAPQIYALLRIVAGLMFVLHGTQKLFGWPGDRAATAAPLMITAGVVEVVGGLMIAAGLLTGWVAFIASGQMAFAYFMRHAPESFWPTVNRGEVAALYCFLWLYVAAHGSGIWSIDGLMRKKR